MQKRGTERVPKTIEEEASDAFVRRAHGEWTASEQAALEWRLAHDSAYAGAYRRVQEAWGSLDTHAEAPEVMSFREEALVYARRASSRRWLRRSTSRARRAAAAAAALLILIACVWQLSPYGYRPDLYRTGIGEQRLVDLDDHSRIALDAMTRLKVRYTQDARVVYLLEGQAQFSVAHDPTRPFKVQAGDHTIVALGTVFTVEYTGEQVHVATMEGRVAVVREVESVPSREHGDSDSPNEPVPTASAPGTGGNERTRGAHDITASTTPIELAAGEEVRVAPDGRATFTPHADLEAATAWRAGKVIFRTERLGDAVRRLNRYSRLQIEIADDVLAQKEISGVFEAGDTQGFLSAVQQYLPVSAEYVDTETVKLRLN
jgi:transmembrane sensor